MNEGRGESHPSQVPTVPPEPAEPNTQPGTSAQRPLITSIEIENFKGIGRPVRIDLRPITLLFGRNSAGKSTILHALCYAHEILSHRNTDPRKLELGGDQIDLGGFRRLVHGHDLDRVVRLRFELSLDGWRVPDRLVRLMIDADPEAVMDAAMDEIPDEWFEAHAPDGFARSGWVTLAMRWDRSADRPAIDTYEVGVNGELVGRLERDTEARLAPTRLAYNVAHPLFDALRHKGESPSDLAAPHETTDSRETSTDAQLARAVVDLPSPMPNWSGLLDLWGADLIHDDDGDLFVARISSMLVGIGDTLRRELASLRYLGPVRRLRPPTDTEALAPSSGDWSDGSAAWNRVLRDDGSPPEARKLIDDVNDWLTQRDRLEVGYRLRRSSTVELPADDFPVRAIRFLESLPATFRNKEGDVDLAGWAPKVASEIAALTGDDPRQIEARLKDHDDGDVQAARPERQNRGDAEDRLFEGYRAQYRAAAACVTYIERFNKGGPAVQDVIRRIAAAPLRRTLELVTAESELPVRTPEIGVGISQLLPVVVAALDPDRQGITAIEQPELHAHPKLQVELGDLFAHVADDGRAFLLENHSEHLMLRLLRRIEETHNGEVPEGKPALRPDQVSVVYLDQVDGEVQATRLRIDETGEFIDRWPHGFFEERSDELF